MNLETLQSKWEKDCILGDELSDESKRIPSLHSEYIKLYNEFNLLKKKSEWDLKKVRRQRWEYYTGKADPSVYAEKPFQFKLLKTDVDKYLESDIDLQKLKQKVDYIQTTVDFLDRTIRQISNRGFTIKNAIDWRKFTSGAV